KPKQVKDFTYHKEKMLLCKQAEKGVPLQAEQSDWLVVTDEEIDEQELEVHYSYMEKIQEVPNTDSGTNSEVPNTLQLYGKDPGGTYSNGSELVPESALGTSWIFAI
ncbi:hypothetical protein Tco_0447601, partial [Tanacetum coccineum]